MYIQFGWPLLTEIVKLAVGEAIAVRELDVIAVEAIEGTDALIERAGALCRRRGWTLLATAGTNVQRQPPTITTATIDHLARGGAGCLAYGAGRVTLDDPAGVLQAADRARIAVVEVET